jgi:dUTP pyrophosphatase
MVHKLNVVKSHKAVKLPKYATKGSAAFDLFADSIETLTHCTKTFNTGLKVEVPEGHVMLIFSRSGHGFNSDIRLANCVGVIDSDYRGELKVKLATDNGSYNMEKLVSGVSVAQGMIIPVQQYEFEVVDELSTTARGEGGFGSTDAKGGQ